MQKSDSLVSGKKTDSPMYTRFGEQLGHYRQRVANLVSSAEGDAAESKCAADELKRRNYPSVLLTLIISGQRYTEEGLLQIQKKLDEKEGLIGPWVQQPIDCISGVALVTSFGCLRPGLLFKRIDEHFVLQSFHYDLPHDANTNLHS